MNPTSFYKALDQLRFGHEAEPPINARQFNREENVQELAASIAAHGQIHPLVVRTIDGTSYVADGNRRLAAQRLRAEKGEIAVDEQIRCEEQPDDVDAAELSLAANIERMPLHEADQLEAFRGLADRGLKEKEIAARFGIEAARVKRMLAIGRLSPKILKAWRDDVFGNQAVECVRAFTLAKSVEEQERVFDQLSKARQLYGHGIRRAFGAGDREASKFVNFVGTKAYVAAGGSVAVDLFGEDHAISDPALAAKLARDKLDEKVKDLEQDGWSWAAVAADLDYSWRWNWQKLGLSKKSATDDDKAKSGAVVDINSDGKLEVTYGVMKPAQAKKEKVEKAKAAGEPIATISNAVAMRLSHQATLAARETLSAEPRLGLVALLAGFLAGGIHGQPVRVKHDGMGSHQARSVEAFESAFERLATMSDAELFEVAAGIAGQSLDMTVWTADRNPFDGPNAVLVNALDRQNSYAELRAQFDAEDYFKSVAKPIAQDAIRESVGDDQARQAGALKKAELVAYCLDNVVPTGWLPPQLRTAHYPGPGGEAGQEAAE